MADAQYVIDVAANMSGGDQTSADLDRMTAGMLGAGKGAEHFQAAIVRVGRDLEAARKVTASTSQALAEAQKEFGLLERSAVQEAKAAEKAARANGGLVPLDLSIKLEKANQAVKSYAGTLKNAEGNATRAAAAEEKLATSLGNVKKLGAHADKTLAAQSERLEKLRGSLNAVGGPLGTLGSRVLEPVQGFSKLTQSIGAARAAMLLGTVAAVGLVAAVVVLSAAMVAGVVAVAAWAVGLADGARNAGLAREAVNAANPAFAALGNHVDKIGAETGIATKELLGLHKSLTAAKVSAEDMPAALRAAALAERALGTGGSADFVEQIKAGKRAVGELADETTSKFGGIVAQQMRGLDAQGEKFKKNIGGIFGGLNIEPVLAGLERLVGLFDKNTTAGATMKHIFESVFQPMINQAENAAIVIEAFAIGFLIGLTKVYIAVKPAIAAVSEFLGFEDASLTDALDMARKAGEYLVPAFLVVVAVFGTLAAVIGIAIGAVVAIQLAIYSMVAAVVYAGVQIISGIVGAFTAVYEYLGGIDLVQIGTDLMMGLVRGITGAAGAVKDAVVGGVSGAIGAAKSFLGIASPAKLTESMGEDTGEGFVKGVENTEADATGAMQSLVTPPAPGGGGGAPAPGGGGGMSLDGATFIFNGVVNAEHAKELFAEALTKILEGDAAALGAAVAP
jgi:hypothetical protein